MRERDHIHTTRTPPSFSGAGELPRSVKGVLYLVRDGVDTGKSVEVYIELLVTRDQFKLKGHTAQLFNLDINGDAMHACTGLPRRLNVTTAKVGKLKIIVPSVFNMQTEPIVVRIDRLDLVLEERDDIDSPSSPVSSGSSSKGSGYGFADKIADGMTLQVHTVNLLFKTHGGAQLVGEASASWAPMASIRNLLLYTTNEKWEVVNLKEARNYSRGKENIYVFKFTIQRTDQLNGPLEFNAKLHITEGARSGM
ncbi:hypothetical protein MTR67_033225 [Solanum verrucosum]|uniref:Uncharacterized protein n=1 Tax=Solanum verrucosum TaxID=315347 RepID=A0AAF0U5X9_SOLVR|nr:hypothetical protein MTR67_033225 [Solanum verrucosum]